MEAPVIKVCVSVNMESCLRRKDIITWWQIVRLFITFPSWSHPFVIQLSILVPHESCYLMRFNHSLLTSSCCYCRISRASPRLQILLLFYFINPPLSNQVIHVTLIISDVDRKECGRDCDAADRCVVKRHVHYVFEVREREEVRERKFRC